MRYIILLSLIAFVPSCGTKEECVQTFSIGRTSIDLPAFLETRVEDGTLVAYPPRTNFANLRYTVISVIKDGKEVANAGDKMIRDRAANAKAKLNEGVDRVWYTSVEKASQGSDGSLMHYWFVGMGGHVNCILFCGCSRTK